MATLAGPERWALLLSTLLHDVPWKPWAVTARLASDCLVFKALERGAPGSRARIIEIMEDGFGVKGCARNERGSLKRNDAEAVALLAWLAERLEAHGALDAAHILILVAGREWNGFIHEADTTAAALDRLLHPEKLEASRFVNMFYPWWTRVLYPEGLDLAGATAGFLNRLDQVAKHAVDSCKGNEDYAGCALKKLYYILYSLLEALWHEASGSATIPPADTRVPNHTVFDHLRASTASLALKRRAIIALVDVPGVHAFVGAARKTRDFWAGSWIVSLLAWAAVRPLVKRLGPQVVLQPSLTLNPFYLDLLSAMADNIEGFFPGLAWEAQGRWPSQPLMPATITLLIDAEELESAFPDVGGRACGKLKEAVENTLRRTWTLLWRGLLEKIKDVKGRLASGNDFDAACGQAIDAVKRGAAPAGIWDAVIRLVCIYASHKRDPSILEALLDYLEAALIEPPLSVKVSCVEVDFTEREYECFVDSVVNELKRIKIGLGGSASALERAEGTQPRGLHDTLSRGLRLVYALMKLREAVESSVNSSHSATMALYRWVDRLWRAAENVGARAYRPCSLCGRLPAVARMPRVGESTRSPLGDFDHRLFSKAVKATGYLADEGEALCPYCLLRRTLARRPSIAGELVPTAGRADQEALGSVLYTANAWSSIVQKLRDTIREVEVEDVASSERLFYDRVIEHARQAGLRGLYTHIAIVYGDGDSVGEGYLQGVLVPRELAREAADAVRRFCGVCVDEVFEGSVDEAEAATPLLYYTALYSAVTGRDRLDGEACLAAAVNAALVVAVARTLGKNIGLDRALTIVQSPSYLQAFSTSLMVSALVDSVIIRALRGTLVYAGGDDVLAVLPVAHDSGLNPLNVLKDRLASYSAYPVCTEEMLRRTLGVGDGRASPALLAVGATRLNYWGLLGCEPGFHVYRGIVAQATAAYGRSYGLALEHVRRHLWISLSKAYHLMDAKNSVRAVAPGGKARYPGKDVVIASYSGGDPAVVPASLDSAGEALQGKRPWGNPLPAFRLLSDLYAAVGEGPGGVFTASLVYDASSRETERALAILARRGAWDYAQALVDRVFSRNAIDSSKLENWLQDEIRKGALSWSLMAAAAGPSAGPEPVLVHVFRALRYLLSSSRGGAP